VGRLHAIQELATQLEAAPEPYLLQDQGKTLPALGFDELPPAGYLAPILDGDGGRAQVDRLFTGTAVKLRFCEVRADYVAGAVQAAQHLDRIPLDGQAFPRPEVDILVPSVSADLPPLKADSYGWVAFVRHSPSSCEPEIEQVGVYLVEMAVDDGVELLKRGELVEAQLLINVPYRRGQEDVPAGILKPITLNGYDLLGMAGVGADSATALVAGRRAAHLIQAWQLGFLMPEAVVSPKLAPIIVIFGLPKR
jgi:hypothetical protein